MRASGVNLKRNIFVQVIQYYSKKENKTISRITDNPIQTLFDYSCLGNIRELENAIASTVLLTTGKDGRMSGKLPFI